MHREINPAKTQMTRWLEIPAVMSLLLIVALQSLSTEDIRFWDETVTLQLGLNVDSLGWPSWSQGATYIDGYWLLGQIFNDPITIYMVMRVIAPCSLVLGVWLAARLLTNKPIAWIIGALAAALPLIYVWPGVAGPASGAVIVAMAVAIKWRSPIAIGIASGLLWLAAGSRPEFTIAAVVGTVLGAGWLFWLLIRHQEPMGGRGWSFVSVGVGSVVLPLLLFLRHGSPLDGWNRSFVAFAQHYGLRHALPTDDMWQVSGGLIENTFPGATTVLGAFRVNSPAFLEHVLQNVLLSPVSLGGHIMGMEPGSLVEPTVAKGIALSVLMGLILAVLVDARGSWMRMRGLVVSLWSPGRRVALAFCLVLVLNVLVTIVTVYPRPHYLLVPSLVVLVLAGVGLARIGSSRFQLLLPLTVVVFLFGVLGLQSVGQMAERVSNPPPYAASLRALNSVDTRWNLLASDRPVEPYVDSLTTIVPEITDGETFSEFLDSNRVNVSLVLPLITFEPYASLPGFQEFYEDPSTFGFTQLVQGSPFWVKSDLLPAR
jgi:hypothetical protein